MYVFIRVGTDHRKMTQQINNDGSRPNILDNQSTMSVLAPQFLNDHSTTLISVPHSYTNQSTMSVADPHFQPII
jgi:hypothetical protein